MQLLEREVSLKTTLIKLDLERRMQYDKDQYTDDRPRRRLCRPESSACSAFTVPELLIEMSCRTADTHAFMRKACEKDVYLQYTGASELIMYQAPTGRAATA